MFQNLIIKSYKLFYIFEIVYKYRFLFFKASLGNFVTVYIFTFIHFVFVLNLFIFTCLRIPYSFSK